MNNLSIPFRIKNLEFRIDLPLLDPPRDTSFDVDGSLRGGKFLADLSLLQTAGSSGAGHFLCNLPYAFWNLESAFWNLESGMLLPSDFLSTLLSAVSVQKDSTRLFAGWNRIKVRMVN